MINKGNLIVKESERMAALQKWAGIIGGCFVIAITIAPIIYASQKISMSTFLEEAPPLIAMIVVGAILAVYLGVYMQISGIRRTPIRIYENGLTPCHPSLKYVFKKEEYFISWEEVRWLEEIPVPQSPLLKEDWPLFIWIVVRETEKGELRAFSLNTFQFKKGDKELVIQTLKQIKENYIIKKGLQKPRKLPMACSSVWAVC